MNNKSVINIMHVCVLIEVFTPYEGAIGEELLPPKFLGQCESFASNMYDTLHQTNGTGETFAISEAAEEIQNLYRRSFGDIVGENAKLLYKLCVVEIVKLLKGLDSETAKPMRGMLETFKKKKDKMERMNLGRHRVKLMRGMVAKLNGQIMVELKK